MCLEPRPCVWPLQCNLFSAGCSLSGQRWPRDEDNVRSWENHDGQLVRWCPAGRRQRVATLPELRQIPVILWRSCLLHVLSTYALNIHHTVLDEKNNNTKCEKLNVWKHRTTSYTDSKWIWACSSWIRYATTGGNTALQTLRQRECWPRGPNALP